VSFTISPVAEPPGEAPTKNYTATAAPSTVTVAKGAKAAVNIAVSSLDFDMIDLSIADSSVISCTWGIPGDNIIPLTIIGLSGGTSDITVKLLDADNNVLAQTAVNVTVTGGSATTTTEYFPGYYPVPDYGVYVGTTPNYIDYDAQNGSTFFTYRISDMTVDMDYAVDGYIDLLEQNGFIFDDLFYTSDGDDIFVFSNSVYHLKVYFTNAKMNDIPSIIVKVTPN